MTCIAVSIKHGVLASDTRCSADGVMFGVSKFRRVGKGIVGAAGDWDDILKFWEYIEGKSIKECGLNDDSELEAIELHPTGVFLYAASGKRYGSRTSSSPLAAVLRMPLVPWQWAHLRRRLLLLRHASTPQLAERSKSSL